jgi:competence protein ComEC
VVVASGMNVTLVAGFLLNLLILVLPRRQAVPVTLIGIWCYSLIAGFDAPIIRAAIMGSIGFTAQVLGKLYYAWRALAFSALAMLIIQPKWVGDIGFILSFVATASLMIFEAKIRKYLMKIPVILREGLSTSLAAQIGVAPILLVTFGQFNLLSPLINALVLWTIAPITIIGAIGGLIGVFVPGLGRMILYLTFPLSAWFVYIVNIFN